MSKCIYYNLLNNDAKLFWKAVKSLCDEIHNETSLESRKTNDAFSDACLFWCIIKRHNHQSQMKICHQNLPKNLYAEIQVKQ